MSIESRGRHLRGRRRIYAKWLSIAAIFASLPVIARVFGEASPWIAETVAPFASYMPPWIAETVAPFAGYVLLWIGDPYASFGELGPYILFDAFGSYGVIMAGAELGAYHGVYGAAWRRWYLGAAGPSLAIFVAILAPYVIPDVAGDWLSGEASGLAVVSVRDVAVIAMGAVLGVNIGRLRSACNLPKWGPYIMECALLSAIFMVAWAAAYAQNAWDDSHDDDGGILAPAIPLTGLAVAGAALSAHYGSYKPRCGRRPWFGKITAGLLGAAALIHIIIDHAMPRHPDLVWMLVLTLSSMCIVLIGNEVGMHISARLKARLGAG